MDFTPHICVVLALLSASKCNEIKYRQKELSKIKVFRYIQQKNHRV